MSLRWRLFLTFTLTVILCLGLVAASVTVILQTQRDRLIMERLAAIATPIATQARTLVRTQVLAADLQSTLKEQAQTNNLFIIFVDNSGNAVTQIVPAADKQPLQLAKGSLPHNLTATAQGKLTTADERTFIYTAFPLARNTTLAATVTKFDTLVLAMPSTEATLVMVGLMAPFLLGGLAVLALSLIIALFLARSIYRPINRVTIAAEKMAQGQYDQRIPVAGPREIRELAASFNKMAEQVKHSQSQLRHFVADVSHQLKTPLTSIHGFAQALLDGTAGDDSGRQRAATIISDESRRMKRQVDELLELARMQAGQLKFERAQVNINELLEHCAEVFEVQAEEKQIKIKIYAELLMPARGDFDRLEQVFSNILDNAIKNSHNEDEIRIIGKNLDSRGVEVRIVDNGPGIPPEQLPHLFERFHQSGGVRSGYGLGLAIAREIVLAHDGSIEARSEPGHGAEFIIILPAAPAGK